jgi:hypothetical protein
LFLGSLPAHRRKKSLVYSKTVLPFPRYAATIGEELAQITQTIAMISQVLAIKVFHETRSVWPAIQDPSAMILGVVKRLVAGELEASDLATPEYAADMQGKGFDKTRNPRFRGLYGRVLSRVCISARIPADLYNALQTIRDWQDTLRKALHALVPSEEEIFGCGEEEVEDDPFYFKNSVRFVEGLRPTSYHVDLMIERIPYKAQNAALSLVTQTYNSLVNLNSDNGMDMIGRLITQSINYIKKAKGDANAPVYIVGSHLLSHLRLLRDEVLAELEYYSKTGSFYTQYG